MRFVLGDLEVIWGTPPPPPPLKALTGAGSAKMLCKILSPKGLEVKILITNDLLAFLSMMLVPLTP